MSLSRIDLDILIQINNNAISINSLAKKYKLTDRSMRYCIDNINYYLNKRSISSVYIKNSKIYLNLENNILINFIKELNTNEYTFSPSEIKKLILFYFLFKNNVRISKLEKYFNVSRTTIKNDIKNLKSYLNNFELYFYISDNRLKLGGKEKKLRHLKFLNIIEHVDIIEEIEFINKIYPNEKSEQKILKEYLKSIDIKKINFIIHSFENKFKYKFSNRFRKVITIYIIVTLERIRNNNIINRKNNADFLIKLPEYKKFKNIFSNIIDKNYKYEILHLMEYFLSDYYKESFYENKVISEKFLIKVLENMNISINKELIDKLMKYLIPAIYRIKNNFIIFDSLDYNAINLDVFCRTKYAIEENLSYLNEPLREEEIYHISKIIENHITKKISLKELLLIIDKHKNKNQLIQILKNRFDKFINDDIFESKNYNILKLLKKNNIFIFNKPITLEKILNRFLYNGLDNKSIIEFNNIVTNFGKYFFIYKKIFLLSTGYINNNKDKSNLYLVISKSPIIIDDEEANILFFMHVNNRTEHLEYISEIMKLADIKDFVENIKVKNTSKDIISYIKNAINN
ncbi:helix-turn-helix domain-containing protein [uncultured Brachyspira sp.]|jgi:mannitol operon transcriptional antiterminator|uniref:helix-turn-helix domain-containing protein n=1 Tax=uncultured Brachyspira sp. TaxID=221953 RepID=UPI00258C2C18|nr:helix-turn-helix domain-containing protein [uncultured Brachyspira sp.]